MNVIYHTFEDEHLSAIIASLHKNYGWEPVCLAGAHIDDDGKLGEVSLDDCIISNTYKIRRGEFNFDEINSPIPIDSSILEALSSYEPTFIDLLGPFQDKSGWEFSYTERKNFYIDVLTYWNTVINSSNPDLIVFYTWPHTPSCYPLYLISKHYYNIDILFIDPAPLLDEGYVIIKNSIENLSNFYENALKNNLKIDSKNLYESSLMVDNQANNNSEPKHIVAEYDPFKNSKNFLKRFLMFSKGRVTYKNIRNIFLHLKLLNYDRKANKLPYYLPNSRMNLFQKFIFFEKLKLKNRKLKKYYDSHTQSPDLNTRFIYFAAPYQPEATSYLGGKHYENILLTIRVLSNACPKDWTIYYKEHPSTFFDNFRGSLKRNNRFYNQLQDLENVKTIPSDYDQFKLIDNSIAVAIICGSSAWQAVIRGKPVISFGQSWYSSLKGIKQVSSLDDVKRALNEIMSGYKPDRKDIDQYVSIIRQVGFKFEEHYFPPRVVYDKLRADEIANEFHKAYERIYKI